MVSLCDGNTYSAAEIVPRYTQLDRIKCTHLENTMLSSGAGESDTLHTNYDIGVFCKFKFHRKIELVHKIEP